MTKKKKKVKVTWAPQELTCEICEKTIFRVWHHKGKVCQDCARREILSSVNSRNTEIACAGCDEVIYVRKRDADKAYWCAWCADMVSAVRRYVYEQHTIRERENKHYIRLCEQRERAYRNCVFCGVAFSRWPFTQGDRKSCGTCEEHETYVQQTKTRIRELERAFNRVVYGTSKPPTHDRGKHRSRARKYGVDYEPGITTLIVAERDNWECALCGVITHRHTGGRAHEPHGATLGHVIPLSRGGGHTWDNVRCECMDCNTKKGNLLDDEM